MQLLSLIARALSMGELLPQKELKA